MLYLAIYLMIPLLAVIPAVYSAYSRTGLAAMGAAICGAISYVAGPLLFVLIPDHPFIDPWTGHLAAAGYLMFAVFLSVGAGYVIGSLTSRLPNYQTAFFMTIILCLLFLAVLASLLFRLLSW